MTAVWTRTWRQLSALVDICVSEQSSIPYISQFISITHSSVSRSTTWNSLPESLSTVDCTATFKRQLKTRYFNIYLRLLWLLYCRSVPACCRPSTKHLMNEWMNEWTACMCVSWRVLLIASLPPHTHTHTQLVSASHNNNALTNTRLSGTCGPVAWRTGARVSTGTIHTDLIVQALTAASATFVDVCTRRTQSMSHTSTTVLHYSVIITIYTQLVVQHSSHLFTTELITWKAVQKFPSHLACSSLSKIA